MQKIDTDIPRTIVGIDVAKDKLDLHILPDNQFLRIDNKSPAIKRFIKQLKESRPEALVVMEYTGGYEKLPRGLFGSEGFDVHIADAKRVHHFARQKGYFGKTDALDAKVIAQFAQQEDVEPTRPLSDDAIELRELNNRRGQIIDDLQEEKCRLSRPVSPSIVRSIKRKIKFLEKEKQAIDELIKKHIDSCPEKRSKAKRLQTFKGVGPTIAQAFVALLPELGTLNRAQISALIGVAPRNRDSGRKSGRRMIAGGRHLARKLLFMGALVAIRHNRKLREVYERLLGKNKPPKVAIVAVMRKMIITLNAMLRDEKNWCESYAVIT